MQMISNGKNKSGRKKFKKKPVNFCAIDFETANNSYDSACAIGLVKVKNNKIVKKEAYYIKPPTKKFNSRHVGIHHITYEDVHDATNFKDLWPTIRPYFRGIDYIVAHNVGFDRSVFETLCEKYHIPLPNKEFLCTMQLARSIFNIRPTKLGDVCKKLKIKYINCHDALEDAVACAKIMIKLSRKL